MSYAYLACPPRSSHGIAAGVLTAVMVANIPEKPTLDGIEHTWSTYGEEQGTYRFDR